MTYTERPPESARAARAAWDYFTARKSCSRRIEALFYSPKCDGVRAWVAELETLASDSQHWGTSYTDAWHVLTATPYEIRRWQALAFDRSG